MTKQRARQILRMLEDMHGEGYIKQEGAGQMDYVVDIERRGEPYVVMTENDWELFLTGGHEMNDTPMTPWHALVARWRAAGFIGWREDGAAFCLLHANSAACGHLIGPKERAFVRAAGLRCALCGRFLVD